MRKLVRSLNQKVSEIEIQDRYEWFEGGKFSVVYDGVYASIFWNSLLVCAPELGGDISYERTTASIINTLKNKADEIDAVIAALEKQ